MGTKKDYIVDDNAIREDGVKTIIDSTRAIYKNKSTDEYKCKGDIKKSPIYDSMKTKLYEDFPKIKGLPNNQIELLRDVLKTLEKPIWSKMVAEFIVKPDEKNVCYALIWSFSYRTLYGEISRIIACTEATEEGFVYRETRVEGVYKANNAFLRKIVNDPEKTINEAIEAAKKVSKVQGKSSDQIKQEAATIEGMGGAAEGLVLLVENTLGKIASVFKSALALNPISFISAVLSKSYDKKVAKCKKFEDLYNEAVKAYDEYKKLPQSKRKERVEHRYRKLIEKYNIKRENLLKEIEHFDKRSREADGYDEEESYDVKAPKTEEKEPEEKKDDYSSKSSFSFGSDSSSDNESSSPSSASTDDFDF